MPLAEDQHVIQALARQCSTNRFAKEFACGVAPNAETIEYAEHSFHEVRDGGFCKMNHPIDARAVQRRLGI